MKDRILSPLLFLSCTLFLSYNAPFDFCLYPCFFAIIYQRKWGVKIFGNAILTKDEIKALKQISKHKKLSIDVLDQEVLNSLFAYGLIALNYTGKKNSIGEYISDDTVSVTNEYRRYKKTVRNNFIERKLPIIISIIALIFSAISLYFSYLENVK